MFTYFYLLNDYGYKIGTLIMLNLSTGYEPDPSDMYNPDLPNFGNRNYGRSEFMRTVAWGLARDAKLDVRLFYVFKTRTSWARCRWDPDDDSVPRFWRYSNITERQICYTPEAVIYASSAYFVCVVMTQYANNIISKTRTLSLS